MDAIRTWSTKIMDSAFALGRKQTSVRGFLGMCLVFVLVSCGGESVPSSDITDGTLALNGTQVTSTADGSSASTRLDARRDSSFDSLPPVTTSAMIPTTTTMYYATSAPSTTGQTVTQENQARVVSLEEQDAVRAAEDQDIMVSWEVAEIPPVLPQPPAANFQDYVQSRFVPTSEDNVSTFSLDTDRTSFHLALNWARHGYQVNPDSVRAEEWINAFNYEYEYPTHPDSFGINTNMITHPLDHSKHLIRIGFQAPDLVDDRPVNVTLVLDASGSMSDGNRVDIAQEAAETIRQSLRPQDRIAVVHFTTDVIHDYTVDHQTPDDWRVSRSIERLAPHDSTNVQAGLNLGVRLADQARTEHPDAYNYIILMSDGVANVDATNPFAILETAHDPDSSNPLRLITIGVGISNYNDTLLEQLAQHGNGWYRYLNDIPQARYTFSRGSWLALSTPFADQTRAQVTWNDQTVASWRMIGYENRITSDESFTQNRKEFAEIPVGAATTVFYELRLHDTYQTQPAGTVNLGDVKLRWVTPINGLSNQQSADLTTGLNIGMYNSEALMQFASVVALASDRYSSLPYIDADNRRVAAELRTLADQLYKLEAHLGDRTAYQDFSFLLEHLIKTLHSGGYEQSGYSQ